MQPNDSHPRQPIPTCCPCNHRQEAAHDETPAGAWEAALGGMALGGMTLTGLSWSMLAAAGYEAEPAPPRRTLVVKPIFTYPLPTRHFQSSWRNWGGIQSQADIDDETARIKGEMAKLQTAADFPVRFLPLSLIRSADEVAGIQDIAAVSVHWRT
jgi:hypothetical protein